MQEPFCAIGSLLGSLFLLGAACTGEIESPRGDPHETGGGLPAAGGGSQAADLIWPVRYAGKSSALRRLSRDELIASMEQLTGAAPTRDELPEEPRTGHGALLTAGLSFIDSEMGKLRLAIDAFTGKVAPAMLDRSGCALGGQAQRDCLLAWSTAFAELALRRPVRPAETETFKQLVAPAGASREDDAAAVEGVLGAVFFAPSFLYRTEVGAPITGKPGLRALDAREIAARLSYLATLGPPDIELLTAAKADRLKDAAERGRQLGRLLQIEAGRRAMSLFVLEWLGANEPKVRLKSQSYLTGLPAGFETSIRASADAAVRKVMADAAEPGVGGLLTTAAYVVDPAVQAVMKGNGRPSSGDVAETARAGLMMHPHVLAAHTKENGSSPFQIGSFIRETFLCQPVPPPPANAAASVRTNIPGGLTVRETLEYQTGEGVCQACHSQFAPLGYAFLPFDPVGRWSKKDPSNRDWDLSGSMATHSGAPLDFKSPAELVRNLAALPQVHGCFAQAALQWALGRALVPEDEPLVRALNGVARETRGNIAALFQAIVAAPEFTTAVAPR